MPPKRVTKKREAKRQVEVDKKVNRSSKPRPAPQLPGPAERQLPEEPHMRAFTRSQGKVVENKQIPNSTRSVRVSPKATSEPKGKAKAKSSFPRSKEPVKKRPVKKGPAKKPQKPAGKKATSLSQRLQNKQQATKSPPGSVARETRATRRQTQIGRNQPPRLSSRNPGLTNWIENLPSDPPEPSVSPPVLQEQPQLDIQLEQDQSGDSMDRAPSPSVQSLASINQGAATNKSQTEPDLFDKLRARGIKYAKTTADEKAELIKVKAFPLEGLTLAARDIDPLVKVAKKFIDQCGQLGPDSNCYRTIEEFREAFNDLLYTYRIFTITRPDFQKDVAQSQNANEFILQRTVMLSAIDRWRLPAMFDYDCEGVLGGSNPYLLKDREGKVMENRKPDLTLFFSAQSMEEDLPDEAFVLRELRPCVFPDGKSHLHCFPFVFIEAKRLDDTLRRARLHNLQSASQALYNIYVCMRTLHEAKKLDSLEPFYQDVRVFSIAFNAERVQARVHRAELNTKTGKLVFHFEDISDAVNYTRDTMSPIVRAIIQDYAEPTLFKILKDTFKGLTELFDERVKNVQKQQLQQSQPGPSNGSPKRKQGPQAKPTTKKRGRAK